MTPFGVLFHKNKTIWLTVHFRFVKQRCEIAQIYLLRALGKVKLCTPTGLILMAHLIAPDWPIKIGRDIQGILGTRYQEVITKFLSETNWNESETRKRGTRIKIKRSRNACICFHVKAAISPNPDSALN